MHFLSGIIAVLINFLFIKLNSFGKIFIVYNIFHALYEIKDYIMTNYPSVRKYIGQNIHKSLQNWSITNTIVNCICDQAIFALGVILGYYLLYIQQNYLITYPLIVIYVAAFLFLISNKQIK
jgi:hypothetical protein